jgi:hypothetical protein
MEIGIKSASPYYNSCGVEFKGFDSYGYTVLEMLPQLVGRPCDDLVMAYIPALRPSSVRIVMGVQTCDSRPWRVTVVIDSHNHVRRIEQEVYVGLFEPFGCGHELDQYVRTGEHHPLSEGGLGIINMRSVRKLCGEEKP